MPHVDVYVLKEHEDILAGRIVLDGGSLRAEPSSKDYDYLLNKIAESTISDRKGHVGPDEPERFLAGLHIQYRTAYLRCSEMIEDAG
jgi:hypothetical protein